MGSSNATPEWMISRKEAAEVVYKDLKEAQRATFEVASGYGRWLIASLVLIHGGALVGVFGLIKDAIDNTALIEMLATAGIWLLGGLLLALGCGFATWLNWSFHSDSYDHMANAEMLWNAEAWARDSIHTVAIPVTYWVSLACGLASAACTIGAAWPLLKFAVASTASS